MALQFFPLKNKKTKQKHNNNKKDRLVVLSISSFSFPDQIRIIHHTYHCQLLDLGYFSTLPSNNELLIWLQAHLSSIYLPSSLFPLNSTDENIKFQFSVFSNSKLFQEVKEGSKSKQLAKITSSVLSLQFGEFRVKCVEYMSCLSSARLTCQTKNMRAKSGCI